MVAVLMLNMLILNTVRCIQQGRQQEVPESVDLYIGWYSILLSGQARNMV